MTATTLFLLLVVGFGALAACAVTPACTAPRAGAPAGRGAALADELIERGAAQGVDVVRLAPGPERALYRAELDGAVLELATNVEPRVVEAVAREIATRLQRSPVPHRLVAHTDDGDVSVAVELGRTRLGQTVTLRRTA
jgi:hypothetical protein